MAVIPSRTSFLPVVYVHSCCQFTLAACLLDKATAEASLTASAWLKICGGPSVQNVPCAIAMSWCFCSLSFPGSTQPGRGSVVVPPCRASRERLCLGCLNGFIVITIPEVRRNVLSGENGRGCERVGDFPQTVGIFVQ